jgi:NOL1/NOP2/fmu family ribosome biogenesis protein
MTRDSSRFTFHLPRPLRDQYLTFCADHLAAVPAEEDLALAGTYLYRLPAGLEGHNLSGLRAIHPGWWLGVFKKERFEPSHALALALRPADARQTLELAPENPEVGAYLRGETLLSRGADGWILVTVSGYSLGWARRVAGVLKSHYPRGLRRY